MSPARGRRVLVTRPEPGASETANRLESLGFLPIRLPLQQTLSLPVSVPGATSEIAAVAVPSSSAIRHAPRHLVERWSSLPCFAVGAATAQVARRAGFSNVITAEGDAESLADSILAKRPASVAYLCGKVRRPVLEEKLSAAGIPVTVIETYDTLPLRHDEDAVAHLLGGAAIDQALVFSANAATLLDELSAQGAAAHLFRNTIFLCISARVADVLGGKGRKIIVATKPSEDALLESLRKATKPAS